MQILADDDVPLSRYAPLFAPPNCVVASQGLVCSYELNLPLLLSEWLFIAIATVIAWLWMRTTDAPVLRDRVDLREPTEQNSQREPSPPPAKSKPLSPDPATHPSPTIALGIKPPWYENTRNVIGIFIFSFLVYANVVMAVMARATLKGNEVIYTAAWTAILFYVMWKRRKWNGWIGATVGFACGVAIVFFATAVTGFLRASSP